MNSQHRYRLKHRPSERIKARVVIVLVLIVAVLSAGGLLSAQVDAVATVQTATIVLPVDGVGEGAIHVRCPAGGCESITLTIQYDPEQVILLDVREGNFWTEPPLLTIDTDEDEGVTELHASGTPNEIPNVGTDGAAFLVMFEGITAGSATWGVVDATLTGADGSSIEAVTVDGDLLVVPDDAPSVTLSAPVQAWLAPNTLSKPVGLIEADTPLPLMGISADGAWVFVALAAFPESASVIPLDNRVWIDALDPVITYNGDIGVVPEVMPTNTPTFTPTFTFTPTNTPTETPTSTPTPTDTPTETPTPTFTPSDTPTNTPTPTFTFTPSNTPTPTLSNDELTATADAISAMTGTAFAAPTRTQEAFQTRLAQGLTEVALSFTPTFTPTPTPTLTPTPSDTPTPTNTPTPSDTPTVTPIPTATPEPVFVTSNSAVNLRAGDGQSFNIVGSFPVGQNALVLGRGLNSQEWLHILLPDGTRAWVSLTVVRVVSGDPNTTPLVEAGTNRVLTNTPSPLRTPTATSFVRLDCSPLVPILPINGFVNGIEAFSWSGIPGINDYRVIIYDAADNIVWTQNVTGTSADINVSTAAIGPGVSFSWEVVALVNGLPECSSFRVTLPRSPI